MEHEQWLWLYSAVVFTTFILVVVYFSVPNRRPNNRLPPGPRSLPFIGHLHLLRRPLQKTFQSLSAQYGPVVGLKLGNLYAVIVSSPAAVEECFGKNDVILANRPPVLAAKHLHYDSITIGTSNYGDHWRNVRRISNQEVFSVSRQNMLMWVCKEEVKSTIKSLFALTRQRKLKVEMKSRINELSFNIIVRIVTGKRYYGDEVGDSAEAKEFREIIRDIVELNTLTPADFNIPLLTLFEFGYTEKKMVNLMKRVDVVLQKLIDESKKKDVPISMLRNIARLREGPEDSDPNLMITPLPDHKTVKGLILMLIAAGSETTASTIEWTMSLLLNNPEKLEKLREEIASIVSQDRLVDESDLPKLKYLNAVLNESLRMYPPAPVLAPHCASADCTIQGFHVPRGTIIFANAWAVQRDPEVWEDPMCFKPERFENGKDLAGGNYSYKFIPFGVGRRSCPGETMSVKVMGMTIASLVQCFDWERTRDDLHGVDMREVDGISMSKLVPLEAMCQPRNSMMDILATF